MTELLYLTTDQYRCYLLRQKIIERIKLSQIYAYLSENNLIAEQQYGFRSHHSTEVAALKLSDTIMCELNRSIYPRHLIL